MVSEVGVGVSVRRCWKERGGHGYCMDPTAIEL